MERLEEENSHTVNDLKLALRRIDDLQAALRDDIETERFDGEDGDADADDYSSEEDDVVGANGIINGQRPARVSRPSSSASTHVSC